jgi:hypothetical protein
MNQNIIYTHFIHRHNFATWCSNEAVKRGWNGINRELVKEALERSGVTNYLQNYHGQIITEFVFDDLHERWCDSITEYWAKHGIKEISYGRAAKSLATYIKAMLIIQENHSSLQDVAHPPIDRQVLQNMSKDQSIDNKIRRNCKEINWTKLDKPSYKQLISDLRQLEKGEPFWNLERYWQ